ncbi:MULTISPECIES: hypothetical protein [Paenibacillus]|uniref:Uncharacterized protein n=1 Tax=Paenibacillus whitsoniae TaxID=2496558 RepID=A0A3S0BXG6_9BACL|nr:hypothetical protein [Paenibacillus whitsoniae]RTE10483.1 hypothetical protein EJQ19_07405 [Paenibacillus whitsoniae]
MSQDADEKSKTYERMFVQFSAKVEKVIIRTAIACLALLILVQALLQNTYIRRHVTRVDPLEGQPYLPAPAPSRKEP